ncbi:hypothetical protein GGI04_000171 [Coemansia thaxteri]|nr:hypothetical protein GGI04_000171 [Coemansia thaxteri]KAJ2474398.1 hypothetical protein GGI02_000108 [Coemansia sp. RSA 2322]
MSGGLPGRAYAKCSTAPLLRGQQLQHAAPADDGRASRQEKRKLHGPAATKRGKPGRGSAAYTPKVQSLAGRGKKNLPRKTQSREQKTILYKWIIDHIDHPFPNDDERKDLTDDGFAKSKFRWWFSNHRHRNLECVEDGNGQRSYRPKLTFYKACQRLGVAIPWEIPEDMRRQLKIAD